MTEAAQILNQTIGEFWTTIAGFAPSLIGALLLLILGWLISRIVRAIVRRILRFPGFKQFSEAVKINETLANAGINITLTEIIAQAVYWIVFLIFVTAAANTLGLPMVAETVNSLVAYVPNVVAAVVIVVITIAASRLVRDVIAASLRQLNIMYTNAIATVAGGVVLIFGLLTAINQLRLDVSLLTDNFTILLIAFVATLGVSFALGSRHTVANLIAGYYVQKTLKVGDDVTLVGIEGKVKEVNATAVVLETEHGGRLIPHDRVVNEGS